jgi:mannose-1-phosphate guanylyltransferase/phosphomannomutase
MKTKAIILAAGFGTRMKEYTKDLPKPMLPLDNKPMIEYTVRQLVAHGIKEIAMNLHYHADKISDHFKTGEKFGAKITYIYEDAPSGTAGGVKKLANFCHDADNVIVIYGDIITDLNYTDFIKAHLAHQKIATICVHKRAKSNSIIEFDSKMQITSFIERPDEATLAKYTNEIWVNSAIYCFRPEILNFIETNKVQDFPKDIFPKLIPKSELFAYKLNAKRYAIDSEEKYLEASENITKFCFSF